LAGPQEARWVTSGLGGESHGQACAARQAVGVPGDQPSRIAGTQRHGQDDQGSQRGSCSHASRQPASVGNGETYDRKGGSSGEAADPGPRQDPAKDAFDPTLARDAQAQAVECVHAV